MSGISADDQYEQTNDQLTGDVPSGDVADSGYTSRVGQKTGPVPVQNDDAPVEDPIDPERADSDEALGTSSVWLTSSLKGRNLTCLFQPEMTRMLLINQTSSDRAREVLPRVQVHMLSPVMKKFVKLLIYGFWQRTNIP